MALIEFENYPSTDTAVNANNLNHNFNELSGNIGNLSNLETTDKTNLVNAINSIIDSESNENGNYIKFSDGTMICWASIAKTFTTSQHPNVYYTSSADGFPSFDFPQSFISTPTIEVTNKGVNWCSVYDSNNTGFSIVVYSVAARTSVSSIFNYIAIGKWK